ncbi:MAG: hypothetical protein ACLT3Y_00225 [Ruminococcus callidus]
MPDCVFLGGSDGAAPELIEHLCQLKQPEASCGKRSDPGNPGGTVSVAAKLPQFEVIQLAVSCGRPWGIITFWKAIIRCCYFHV